MSHSASWTPEPERKPDMPKHRLSMPPSAWPEDVRKRFDRHVLTPAQRTRLGQGLGRWFRIATDLGADPAEVTRAAWEDRTRDMRPEMRNAVRQALSVAYPKTAASLYASEAKRTDRPDVRQQLRHTIRRTQSRFPEAWRQAAAPLLHVDPDGVGDGILVQAWAPSTIERRLEAGAAFFEFCAGANLPADITSVGVRAKLRRDQALVAAGKRRIGAVSVDLVALTAWPVPFTRIGTGHGSQSRGIGSASSPLPADRGTQDAPSMPPSFVPPGSSSWARQMPTMRRPATSATSSRRIRAPGPR
jgi:hypothetical protein